MNQQIAHIDYFLLVTGVGDPHINTIDNGRYTCHIQGRFIFAQTTNNASQQARLNDANVNINGDGFLFSSDLFEIRVRSAQLAPAMAYVERMQGTASVFTAYTIVAANNTYRISKIDDKFGKKRKCHFEFFHCFFFFFPKVLL